MTDQPTRARCLIVDDEAPAREELRYLLEGFDDVRVVGEATNAEEALDLLSALDYDVVLLDIRMPGGTGLDVAAALREAQQRPAVIFTTAYPDHAVEAFDVAAADYVLKPFDAARLRRALDRGLRARDAPAARRPESRRGDDPGPFGRIPVQHADRTVLVDAADIVFAQAARGYSKLQLRDEQVLVSLTLADLERRLGDKFFRAHRSYLVNLDAVRELVPDFRGGLELLMTDAAGSRVEVSRRQARELRRLLGM